ncbi:MAG: PadR family transcriptional regulator [Bacteroidota bacterium]
MKKKLGEFEELILTVVAILREEAYGNAIVSTIKKELNREVNLSAVHITLYRLEDKGLVTSHYGGATATRGGRRKRFFQISNAGRNYIDEMQAQRMKLWRLLPD